MNKTIEHSGIVVNVRKGYVDVRIIQKSACAGCHAKSACSAADMAEKIIEVPYFSDNLKKGDQVILVGSDKMGWIAVMWAFIIPLILVLATLIIASELLKDELLGGIITLCILIPYYFLLYLLRNRMKKNFVFTLK